MPQTTLIDCNCSDESCSTDTPAEITGLTKSEFWQYLRSNRRFNYLVITAIFAIIGSVIQLVLSEQMWISALWWIGSLIGLVVPLQLSWKSLRNKRLTINTLLSVAALAALLLQLYEEAIVLVIVFSIGEIMESVLVQMMRRELDILKSILPGTALLVKPDGSLQQVDISQIKNDQQFLVNTGDIIPVDGYPNSIIEIQQAHLTGEVEVETIEPGEKVFAGSVLVRGSTHITSMVDADSSYVHGIVRSVEDSIQRKSSTERFSQNFGKWYTPVVFGLALVIAFGIPVVLGQQFMPWIMRALVILVVSCACGLAVSVPVTMVSAVTSAAKQQILLRGGAAVERISKVRTVVFDKTGTLTLGKPQIRHIEAEERLLPYIKAMTTRSNHPVSQAIHRYLNLTESYSDVVVDEVAGLGISAKIDGISIRVIRDISGSFHEKISKQYGEATSYSLIEVDGCPEGYVVFEDQIRPHAKEAIAQLQAMGLTTVMITGDNRQAAELVAAGLGIDEVYAQVLPEDKKRLVQKIQQQHGMVAMVGDGINDAPALAESDVGIAMGASGTEIAAEVADVVLIDDNLEKVVQTIRHGSYGFQIARQNVILALATVAGLLALAAAGVLDLVSGIIANEGTAILIIANGLRMLKFRGRTP